MGARSPAPHLSDEVDIPVPRGGWYVDAPGPSVFDDLPTDWRARTSEEREQWVEEQWVDRARRRSGALTPLERDA
jgi:hypothetical protein